MSGIKINFDSTNNPIPPLIVIGQKNGHKINGLIYDSLVTYDKLNSSPEFTCVSHKMIDGKENPLWNDIRNLRTAWVKEWDTWFDIEVEKKDNEELSKNITGQRLGESELSNIKINGLEINTEDDIDRDDYTSPTVFYSDDKSISALDRVLSYAPHYHIGHVDDSLKNIQRSFSFDNTSVMDAFKDMSEEIDCLIVAPSHTAEDGTINREICAYDLEPHCECGYRNSTLKDKCPKCGSTNIFPGYGKDTTVFVSTEDFSSESTLSNDMKSVKNCFRMEAGDEDMTAAIVNCMPSGSKYYWYFSDEMKNEMSDSLRNGIELYEQRFEEYYSIHEYTLSDLYVSKYNSLVDEYGIYADPSFEKVSNPIVGYPTLVKLYYDVLDMYNYLEFSLMPTYEMQDTNAAEQANLVRSDLTTVSVTNIDSASLSIVNNAVSGYLKVILDTRYKSDIVSSSYDRSSYTWTGTISISNYSEDEDDVAEVENISVTVNDDYETYVKQQIEKALQKGDDEDYSISGLFKKDQESFEKELKKYGVSTLSIFLDSAQAVVNILVEQNVADNNGFAQTDLYTNLYIPYYNKLKAIESAIVAMDEKISYLASYDDSGILISGLQKEILDLMNETHNIVKIENCVGSNNLSELYSFRMDDTYSNENYVSDGFTNKEIFQNAAEFISVVKDEIFKSSFLQNIISSSLNNLLTINKFHPLIEYFENGNWIRVLIDKSVYKLRIIDFEVDHENNQINVEFSDVTKTRYGVNDSASILSSAASISKTYNSVKRQASLGAIASDKLKQISGGISL